ncbi:alpha/beta-hydrolase [Polyplosphaeria fusca]|uniref:Alpha/beta-hydrolase n=1 Tax=Polyplosphaeria fusca TaxID=682080 RepID=A0A9P4V2F1_9PLEO|nr:alpha/beta-hydrolase [Polyplosphaeria fusca]
MSTKTFEIHIHDDQLTRLRQKLALSDFPIGAQVDDSWNRGPPVAEIKRLVQVWHDSYDWRKAEARLNAFPQFTTSIDVDEFGSYEVHHIHKKSSASNAVPLLFLHGWPGSFIEVTKVLDDLVEGQSGGTAFHVVAPSLIDFGFSSPSKKESFQFEQHAEAYHKLMLNLGYTQYVIQAGDVGSLVARFIAMRYGPFHCKAYHTNTPVPAEPKQESHPEVYSKILETPLTEAEKIALQRLAHFSQEGNGYYKQQTTKPLTIGYALKDSPVALLAWLYEKMHDWTDNYPWSDDEILTWVSIYYFSTPGPDASSNVYYAMEHHDPPAFAASQVYIKVPFGVARFHNDLVMLPKLWNHTLGPFVFDSEHERGGHFAAWERPDVIVKDLLEMFHGGGAAYGFGEK